MRGEFELVEFKATEDADQPAGLFAALVSVFGTKDRVGDRVMKGAFTETLERWRASGKSIPVVWSHDHLDPTSYIGEVDPNDVRETEKGLVVAGKIDVTEPKAAKIFGLLKRGLVRNWSFAYQATKSKMNRSGEREISQLDLFEIGPTLVGAHGGTATLALKALDLDEDIDWDALEAAVAQGSSVDTTTETKLDRIVRDEFNAFEAAVDAAIEEKVGRVISDRTATRIRNAVTELTSLLAEAGVTSDTASVESEEETEQQETPSEQPEATSGTVPEAAALSERDKARLALAGYDAFIAQHR